MPARWGKVQEISRKRREYRAAHLARRARQASDPEALAKMRTQQRAYYAAHCEEINRKERERRASDPEARAKRREQNRAYREELNRKRRERYAAKKAQAERGVKETGDGY